MSICPCRTTALQLFLDDLMSIRLSRTVFQSQPHAIKANIKSRTWQSPRRSLHTYTQDAHSSGPLPYPPISRLTSQKATPRLASLPPELQRSASAIKRSFRSEDEEAARREKRLVKKARKKVKPDPQRTPPVAAPSTHVVKKKTSTRLQPSRRPTQSIQQAVTISKEAITVSARPSLATESSEIVSAGQSQLWPVGTNANEFSEPGRYLLGSPPLTENDVEDMMIQNMLEDIELGTDVDYETTDAGASYHTAEAGQPHAMLNASQPSSPAVIGQEKEQLTNAEAATSEQETDYTKTSEPVPMRTRPAWGIRKDALREKFGAEGWQPRKKLSPDSLNGVRALHESAPEIYTIPVLSAHLKVSPEAIRRILKSKWRPKENEVEDRRTRWEARGVRKRQEINEHKERKTMAKTVRRHDLQKDFSVVFGDDARPYHRASVHAS